MRMKRTAACIVLASAVLQPQQPAAGRLLQQSSCPDAWEPIAASNSSSVDSIRSVLFEAGVCAAATNYTTASVISVHWTGSIETSGLILVPRGVDLRVNGDGWDASYNDSDEGNEKFQLDAELKSAIADAAAAAEELEPSVISSLNGTASLFVVEAGGALHLSNITLSGAWGAEDGGGGVRILGGEVTGTNVLWESLAAAGPGGAINAGDGSLLELKGLNIFQACWSSALGGGAVFAANATFAIHDSAQVYFESCSAEDGGCVELTNSRLTLSSNSRARFRFCTAGDKGGGLYTTTSAIDVGDMASVEFQACAAGNVSGTKGGGVCAYESDFLVGTGAAVTFLNNSSPTGDGGGLYGQTTTVQVEGDGTSLLFTDNVSGDSGGGLFLEWPDGDSSKACLVLAKDSALDFSGNDALEYGGGVFIAGCVASISGNASFRGNTAERAGALYVEEAGVFVSGDASFIGNKADRWGGAVYVLDSRWSAGYGLQLTGGVEFSDNEAGRSGGGIYIVNSDVTIVRDAGEDGEELAEASLVGNRAGYDGGVVAVDGGSLRLEGCLASSNRAVERGGAVFGTGESTVNLSTVESWNNSAAAGGALYLSSSVVHLTDLSLVGDRTPSGANIFLTAADVWAVNVSVVAPEQPEATFALHVGSGTVLLAFAWSFDQWEGDSTIVVSEGLVVMDACDFSSSRATTLVDASRALTIRNAILGDNNFDQAGFNASSSLGIGGHDCASLPEEFSCTVAEECEDAENGMGVLCPAFTEAATGSFVSLTTTSGGSSSAVELVVASSTGDGVSSFSLAETPQVYYPELVTEELVLRHSSATSQEAGGMGGTGGVLWEIRRTDGGVQTADEMGAFAGVSPDMFTWTAFPWSGYLAQGQELTIRLVGTPPPPDPSTPFAVYNGEVGAEFQAVWRTAETDSELSSGAAGVERLYYVCQVGWFWDGEKCVTCAEQMAEIAAGEGALECSVPGVTLDTLPLAKGYWRGDVTQTLIRECLNPNACVGGRGMVSSSSSASDSSKVVATAMNPTSATTFDYDETRYCEDGQKGPLCSLCEDGYRRLSGGQLCISCSGKWTKGMRGPFLVLGVAAVLSVMVLMVLLVGGVAAVSKVMDKVVTCGRGRSEKAAAVTFCSAESTPPPKRGHSSERTASSTFGARVLRAVPFQKLKILIVVWQILTQFSHLADIPYPPTYKRFLDLLDVFNFDITWPMTAACLLDGITFYQRLVAVTLGPLVFLTFLLFTYAIAMRVHRPDGFGKGSPDSRQGVMVRHGTAALIVLFLVFSSVSTTVFSTYACDYVEDLDVSLLRADYSISCDHPDHTFYKIYAALMIFLYPVGIPALFAVLLLERREKINPTLLPDLATDRRPSIKASQSTDTAVLGSSGRGIECPGAEAEVTAFAAGRNASRDDGGGGGGDIELSEVKPRVSGAKSAVFGGEWKRRPSSDGGGDQGNAPFRRSASAAEDRVAFDRDEVLDNRAHDPDLQSTRFLWAPYEPENYYYETVECGRRCLLTGALVFVLPNTAGQVAGACVFAFISLLAFELLRPHLSRTDAWMYRVGCVVIFFSNFLALMAKADVSRERADSQEVYGILLIGVHVVMVVAIMAQVLVSLQAAAESRDDVLSLQEMDSWKHPIVVDDDGTPKGEHGGCSSVFATQAGERWEGLEDGGGRVMRKSGVGNADAVASHPHRAAAAWGREDVEGERRSSGRRSNKSQRERANAADDEMPIPDSVKLERAFH